MSSKEQAAKDAVDSMEEAIMQLNLEEVDAEDLWAEISACQRWNDRERSGQAVRASGYLATEQIAKAS